MKGRTELALVAVALMTGCGASNDAGPTGEDLGAQGQALVPGDPYFSNPPTTYQQPGEVTTGKEGNLPVCRVWYANTWHPGKVWPTSNGQCLFEYGGQGLAAGPNMPNRPAQVATFETGLYRAGMHWQQLTRT